MSYIETYRYLYNNGTKHKTPKRQVSMSLYGSTIGRAQYPKYITSDGLEHILPRPYTTFKPGNIGYNVSQQVWFRLLIHDIERTVLQFITCLEEPLRTNIMNLVNDAKKYIPDCCRISNTFFSHMTVIGDLINKGVDIPTHRDKDDIITAILHLGDDSEVTSGTDYYNGKTECGDLMYSVPFFLTKFSMVSIDGKVNEELLILIYENLY